MDINVMALMHSFQPIIAAMKVSAKLRSLSQFVGIASVAGIHGYLEQGLIARGKLLWLII